MLRGVGECGWNRETGAFSLLLAKDALNMQSFPQRGLLYVVSLDPRPHRLKPIGKSCADSPASAGGCYVWLWRGSSAEQLGTYADARWWWVGRAACPCSPVEVTFQVTVVLLSTLPSSTCLWCGWRGMGGSGRWGAMGAGMPRGQGSSGIAAEPRREGCAMAGRAVPCQGAGLLACCWLAGLCRYGCAAPGLELA